MGKTYLPSEMADRIRNGYRNNLDVLGFGNKPGNMIYDLAPNPGITDPIHYEKIAEAINELLSGVDYRNYDIFAEREITENGEYVAFDDDTYGYSRIVVDVPQMVVAYTYDEEDEGKVISNGEFVTQEPLTINQNGVYDTTAINTVTVNVEGSSGLEEIFEIDAFIDRTISSIANQRISSIGNYAFAGCSLLSSISFPKCKTIGSSAFRTCLSLESAFFPECNQIDQYAFEYCRNLVSISFPECEHIGSYAFRSCLSLTNVFFPECSQIDQYAFSYCTNLLSVSFPKCKVIDDSVFCSCRNLASISFPECEQIGPYAFAGCSSLESAFFPECSRIDQYAFSYCSKLLTASFPKCKVIDTGAFYSCRKLSQLYLLGSSLCNLLASTAFNGTSLRLNGTIYVPESLYSSYVNHSQWQYYSERFFSYISESIDGEDFEASVDNTTLLLNGSQVLLSSTTLLIDGSSASITNGQLDL